MMMVFKQYFEIGVEAEEFHDIGHYSREEVYNTICDVIKTCRCMEVATEFHIFLSTNLIVKPCLTIYHV